MSETFDARSRAYAVDPTKNVVLEASAGTGKTRVLVERYVNLLRAGVDPEFILAITFTRKAAAEMRDRIIERLREASRQSEFDRSRWRELKDRLGDIAISTIDAFCLSLLREFPLEADVDPAFELADETESPRLVAESLDRALRVCRGLARESDDVALVFAQLGERRLRTGLTQLLERRLVAPQALRRFLAGGPQDLTVHVVCTRAARRLADVLTSVSGGLNAFLADGPLHSPEFSMFADDIRRLAGLSSAPLTLDSEADRAWLRQTIDRAKGYFLTTDGRPRNEKFQGSGFNARDCSSDAAWKRHRVAAASMAPAVREAIIAFRRDLNVALSRGVWRVFGVTLEIYRRTLEAHALLDFSGVLERAVKLLRDMDEFAESRFRLEARYRHVLVDEFQDTSRAQWELVSHLVRSWGEGFGAAADALAPTIFVVGDRKQSIYGFRDAEVALLTEAAEFIRALRPDEDPVNAISVSFRARPPLLAFVNDLFEAVEKQPERHDAFVYGEHDRFPARADDDPVETALGVVVGASMTETAEAIAAEVERLLGAATVRDRMTGLARPCRPADIAILFRSRDAHREYEKALERRGISTYVYKGLGFFDADEIQDAVALLRFFADPASNLRAASFLRSRLVRLSDRGLAALAPSLADALLNPAEPAAVATLPDEDRSVLDRTRRFVATWLPQVDRLAPADLLRAMLADCGYVRELPGPRAIQAAENLKKLRSIIRRFQNRGFATLSRVADHLDELAVGDESNAAIDAVDSVSLMTVHASKGLEFPIVFVVNMNRGTGTSRAPVRVVVQPGGEPSVAVADYQSEADDDVSPREKEETKRLLYVALTRARDRLYVSASLANGTLRATRGSLAEVLPAPVRTVLEQAAMVADEQICWKSHTFVVARR